MKFIKGIPKISISISSTCRRSFLSISVKVRDGGGEGTKGQDWHPHLWRTTLTHKFEGWTGRGPTMIEEATASGPRLNNPGASGKIT